MAMREPRSDVTGFVVLLVSLEISVRIVSLMRMQQPPKPRGSLCPSIVRIAPVQGAEDRLLITVHRNVFPHVAPLVIADGVHECCLARREVDGFHHTEGAINVVFNDIL